MEVARPDLGRLRHHKPVGILVGAIENRQIETDHGTAERIGDKHLRAVPIVPDGQIPGTVQELPAGQVSHDTATAIQDDQRPLLDTCFLMTDLSAHPQSVCTGDVADQHVPAFQDAQRRRQAEPLRSLEEQRLGPIWTDLNNRLACALKIAAGVEVRDQDVAGTKRPARRETTWHESDTVWIHVTV